MCVLLYIPNYFQKNKNKVYIDNLSNLWMYTHILVLCCKLRNQIINLLLIMLCQIMNPALCWKLIEQLSPYILLILLSTCSTLLLVYLFYFSINFFLNHTKDSYSYPVLLYKDSYLFELIFDVLLNWYAFSIQRGNPF